MPSPDSQRGFWAHLQACNRHDPAHFETWWIGNEPMGYVRRDRVARMLRVSSLFHRANDQRIIASTCERAALDDGLATLAEALVKEGEIARLTGEPYAVAKEPQGQPRAVIDRGAAPWFGIRACGVHLNGFVRRGNAIWLWVAERSHAKPLHAGQLDHIVAGGQPAGLSLRENLVKECAEEADIPAAIAASAVAVGHVRYCLEDERGLKPDTMYCFDLELPASFIPRNTDGEVERFELMPAEEVVDIVRRSQRFKFNCNLVLLDFFLRHGLLNDPPAEQLRLRQALQQSFGDPLPAPTA